MTAERRRQAEAVKLDAAVEGDSWGGDIGGQWQTVPLSDLTDPETPVTYGVVKPGPEDPNGVLFIRSGDIADGRVKTEQLRTIAREVSQQYRRTQLRGGEIVVSLVGNPGQAAIVPESLKGANIARQAGLVRLRGDIDTRFVRYFLSSRTGQQALGAYSRGSVQQVINLRDLKTLLVPVPPLPKQRAIAHILGTLDEKIELNRRMNETLEAMARALFKSWFVDFDPVRAKAEGRDPGLPESVADLFPDRLVDTDVGEIPEGWTCSALGDWVTPLSGGTPRKSDTLLWHGTIPWISPKVMTSIHADSAEQHVAQTAIGNGTRLAPAGATLVMVRGMGLHESVRISYVSNPVTFNQDVKALVPHSLEPCLLLFALLCGQGTLLDRVESSGHGTGRLPSDVLLSYRITMPCRKSQQSLVGHFDNLNERIASLRAEERILASLRNTLLPKLISGQLRVKDAERFLEGAGA